LKENTNYIQINKALWNAKTDIHINSDFYDNETFVKEQNSLNEIELALLGNVKGKSILHLQCHFGQDSISLQGLGAVVTGVDFSDKAIIRAKELAVKTNSNTTFICSDVYDLPNILNQKFDLVFTSYGTIGWLPDLDKWAGVISHFLKPNGKFVFAEFHPVVWMFDADFSEIKYKYSKDKPIIEDEVGTYADKESSISNKAITWNHSIAEVVTSLLEKNLEIKALKEYDYSPYDCFNKTQKISDKKYRIAHLSNKIPMVYAIVAKKTN